MIGNPTHRGVEIEARIFDRSDCKIVLDGLGDYLLSFVSQMTLRANVCGIECKPHAVFETATMICPFVVQGFLKLDRLLDSCDVFGEGTHPHMSMVRGNR